MFGLLQPSKRPQDSSADSDVVAMVFTQIQTQMVRALMESKSYHLHGVHMSAVSKAPKRTFPKTRTLQQTEDATRQTADQVSPSIGVQPDTQQQLGASAQQFVVQTNAYPHLQGSNPNVCADQKEQEENQDQDFLRQLKQDGVRHAELGSFLDKLGGAIAGKHVTTLDMKHGAAKQTVHQRKEEDGRLNTAALRHLFQDVHRIGQSPEQLDLDSLSHRYGVDRSLLKKVLHYNRLPAVTQHADGRLVGSWQWKAK